jgi:dTDP-4-dehydrorhamnose reductase
MVVVTIETSDNGTIIILGGRGMLGSDLVKEFPEARWFGRELDITDRDKIRSAVLRAGPRIVINAAAYTDVDGCEENRDHAMLVNGEAPGFIAGACREAGATLVHYSTDYVFDGRQEEYLESDIPGPINVYGESKLLGEQRIQEEMDDFRIVRTSWLFGVHGKNFVETIIALSEKEKSVRVVNDQFGKPTYTKDLAAITPDIIRQEPGIFHITNEGICSWFEFARAFIPNAVPCTSEEFPRRAKRPKFSVLRNTRVPGMRHWKDALHEYLEERKGGIIR